MSYGLTILDDAAGDAIDLAIAKAHLQIVSGDQDALIKTVYIPAAAAAIEHATGRRFLAAQLRLTLSAFPRGAVALPRAPVTSVDRVFYVDAAGVEQELALGDDYRVYLDRTPAEVELIVARPTVQTRRRDAVGIEFTAGYGDAAAAVPPRLTAAALLVLGHLMQNRQEVVVGPMATQIPAGAQAICQEYSIGDEFIDYEEGLRCKSASCDSV